METATTPTQAGIKAGVIVGLITTVLTFLVYFINYELMVSAWYGFGTLAIYVGLIIYFGIQYRREIGGFMAFGTAFQYAFIALVVMLVISTFGSILLFAVLDSGLGQRLAELTMENTLRMMDSFGAGELPSDQMDEMRKGFEEAYTVPGMLKGAGFMLIFYAILALILGAIIKKKDKSLDY